MAQDEKVLTTFQTRVRQLVLRFQEVKKENADLYAMVEDNEKRIKELLQQRLDGEVVMDAEVDPSLIGGFTLTVDDKLLDASVSHQLDEIRRQLMEKNKRIV